MKYYTIGIVFIIFSLITIVITFYYSNLTRSVEKDISRLQLEINAFEDKIKVNEIEYAAHLSSDYLKRLEHIYFIDKSPIEKNFKIVGIEEFSFKNLGQIIKVTSN